MLVYICSFEILIKINKRRSVKQIQYSDPSSGMTRSFNTSLYEA